MHHQTRGTYSEERARACLRGHESAHSARSSVLRTGSTLRLRAPWNGSTSGRWATPLHTVHEATTDHSTRARPLRDERSPRNGTHPSRHRDGTSRTHTHRRDPTNQNTPHHTSHHPRRRRDRALTTPHNGTNRDGNETTTHPAEPHHPATHTRTPATRTPQDELREEPHNGTPPQRTVNEKNPHRHTASGASGLLYAPTAAPVRAVAPEDVLTHSGTRDARHTARSRRP